MDYYNLKEKYEEVKTWYDGYIFGEDQVIYKESFINILKSKLTNNNELLINSLINKNIKSFEIFLKDLALNTLSYYDTSSDRKESPYHAFLLGVLSGAEKDYIVKSNKESGSGRYDICLIPRSITKLGIVIEIKEDKDIEKGIKEGTEQMIAKKYDSELKSHGVTDILRLVIVFSKNEVKVVEVIGGI